jgi:hypothetical protein
LSTPIKRLFEGSWNDWFKGTVSDTALAIKAEKIILLRPFPHPP